MNQNMAMMAILSRPVVGEMAHSLEQVAKLYSQNDDVNLDKVLVSQK
mgnify:FL=1|jgi:hypothetical protein